MAANLQLSTTLQNAFLTTAVLNLFNAGSIEVRSGTQPANANAAAAGTVLATLPLGNPAFGAITNGSSTANAIATGSASATGTATWARVYSSAAVPLMDLSVGTTSSNLVLNSTSIVAAGPVSISSFVFSVLAQGQ